MSELNQQEIKKQVEFDRAMTSARMFRSKGDYLKAGESIAKALEINPLDLDAREFAADLIYARGNIQKASEYYKGLYSPENPRPSAEEKYAKCIIEIEEGKRQQHLLQDRLNNPGKYKDLDRSPVIAAVISVAPGFGQIYNGDFKKGIILCASTMFFWILFYFVRPDVSSYPVAKRAAAFFVTMNPFAILFIGIASFLQIYAFIDATVTASKRKEKKKLK